jgi:hypothetical protein
MTEVERVYCAVRIESLYNTNTFRLKRLKLGGILTVDDNSSSR